MIPNKSDMNAASKIFFTSARYGVVGASSDPHKFGHKIFAWYLGHGITPTPLNPSSSTITVGKQSFPTKASPLELEEPEKTSLSIITPPAVTSKVLKQAKQAGIKAVWLQPGSFDDKVLSDAHEAFPGAAIGGEGGRGSEGWCVLVDGEAAMHLGKL